MKTSKDTIFTYLFGFFTACFGLAGLFLPLVNRFPIIGIVGSVGIVGFILTLFVAMFVISPNED